MSDNHTSIIRLNPTVTAGAYTAADAVGGLLTFEGALKNDKKSGVVLSITIQDNASQESALDLVLFNQSFTATADNAAFAPSDADLVNCLGIISILSTDYSTFSTNSIATLRNVGMGVKSVNETGGVQGGDGSIYGQLVARGTPTYVAVTDLSITLTILQD